MILGICEEADGGLERRERRRTDEGSGEMEEGGQGHNA